MAVTVTHLGTTFNTTAGNKTVVATPNAGDYIVVFSSQTGGTQGGITDNHSDGGQYSQVGNNQTGYSTSGLLYVDVRLIPITTSVSVTWTASQASSTGGGLTVLAISNVPKYGLAAVRTNGGQSSGTAATTPAPVLGLVPLVSSVILSAVSNGTNLGGVTARANYTRDTDSGYNTPTTGLEVMHLVSGENSATITWGGT